MPSGKKHIFYNEYLKLERLNQPSILVNQSTSTNLINPNTWTSHDSHHSAKITFKDEVLPALSNNSNPPTPTNKSPHFNIIQIEGNILLQIHLPFQTFQFLLELLQQKLQNILWLSFPDLHHQRFQLLLLNLNQQLHLHHQPLIQQQSSIKLLKNQS